MNKLLIIGLVLLICILPASATNYYVSPTGNDRNAGTEASPFKTIQHAADIVNPGDTVIVKDGTYTDTNNDGYVIYLSRSGNPDNVITFKSENKWGAILGVWPSYWKTGIYLYNANYIRFEDFDITGTGGIEIYESHDVYLYNLHIHDIGQFACPTSSKDDYDAKYLNEYFYHYNAHWGIYLDGTTSNITFDSLLIHNIGRLPCSWMQWIDYNRDHGYYVAGDNNHIINNIFYSISAGWPVCINGGDDWLVSNNVFYGSNEYQPGRVILTSFANQVITDAIVQNNVAYHLPISSGYYPTATLVDIYLFSDTSKDILVRNNLVYKQNNGSVAAALVLGGHGTPDQWTESNNILYQDPKFVNAANRDYHLQSTSPAINNGTSVSAPIYDYDGNPRTGRNDIGAFQYVNISPLPTPTPIIPSPTIIQPTLSTSQIISSIWSWIISIFGV